MGADLMEFAAPEISGDVSGRKKNKSAAKKIGRQILRKMLGSGIEQTKVIPTKTTEKVSRPRGDNFTKLSR